MRKIINDGVEASTRKSQARFQIILVSSSAEPRMRLELSENLPEISLSQPQPHHTVSGHNYSPPLENSIDLHVFSCLQEKIFCFFWSTYFYVFGVI